MAERTWMEQVVERVVSQVLETRLPRLREDLVQRVLEELQPQLGASSRANPAELLRAISGIHAGTTQREILRALLDSAVPYCRRAALFVVKSGKAMGWQGRGFVDIEAIKDFSLNVHTGLGARALRDRTVADGTASEMDLRFIEQFGKPSDEQVLILPLMLKDKVAALMYADAGIDADVKTDSAALELLVFSTSAWLEVASLRKQASRESTPESPVGVAVGAAPSFADPFPAHASKHIVATEAPSATGAAILATTAVAEETPVEDTQVAETAKSATAASAGLANLPPEEAEVHRKAQRFAKLLVDQIKLYNQAKVTEGRENKDLYDRLKEDIEKSRVTFQKRYGATAAASAEYFQNELIHTLAEDDLSIMGANFRR